jgi:hypothetical protein
MFKIEFYVDDKNLGETFKRLSGLAREITHSYVPNAVVDSGGRLKTTTENSLKLIENEIRKLGGTINAGKMQEAIGTLGFSPASYSYFMQQMTKRKILRRVPGGKVNYKNTYVWVK